MNLKIVGKKPLSGTITPSGSKNSVVALIPATILFNKPITLTNVPDIVDVNILVSILKKLESSIDWNKDDQTLTIDNSNLKYKKLTKELLGNIRAITLLWGPMLARFGKIYTESLPGGCTLGKRSSDPHFQALLDLGIEIKTNGNLELIKTNNIEATTLWLTEMSPTITEDILLLTAFTDKKVKIIGAASEPHTQDLCNFLVQAGKKIQGIGSSVLEISGTVNSNKSIKYNVISDHQEIGTYAALASITRGNVKIKKAIPEHFSLINYNFERFGLEVSYQGNTMLVNNGHHGAIISTTNETQIIKAQPWPALPVDILPLFIPLAISRGKGNYLFHNWMYERGLFWTYELLMLGADITLCDPHRVLVRGGTPLKGGIMDAPYIIRGVVALIMAALDAEGESIITNADAVLRGHPNLIENLKSLGADIEII
ncbi:UDP-N-acetylglucosamine 1-carboxyvinyltransferase [Patescibacteria group bacterium]